LTATVTSGATGKVTFYDGVTILGVGTISGAQASISTVMLPSGNRKLRAHYQGDGTYAASSSATVPQSVLAGKSNGFQPPLSDPGANFNGTAATVVGDFNDDGKQDFILVNYPYRSLTIYLGNGDGTFQTGRPYAFAYDPTSVAVGDFNGDGHADLAVGLSYTDSIAILRGNGDGTFQPAVYYACGSTPTAIAVADFNRDGLADLIVNHNGAYDATSLSLLLGKADGTFQNATSIPAGSTASSIAVADFNGDGAPDVVVALGPAAKISILLGNGDGTFQAPKLYAYSDGADVVSAADFNGDGHPDVLVTASIGEVYVLLGNGDGTLGPPLTYSTGYYPESVLIGDFDGDGFVDLAITHYFSSIPYLSGPYIGIAPGHGDGTFGAAALYPALNFPYTGAVGDFNGDGRTDMVTSSAAYSGYTIFLGNAVAPITIQTTPTNLQFTVDNGAPQTAPQTLNLAPGTHTIAVASPQTAPGTQYVFTGWSDSGAASHTITVGATAATYTATFKTQYLLTTAAFPQSGGTVTPASGAYYDAGSPVTITATPNPPLTFTGWSGAASTSNPLQITMSAPLTIAAAFDIPGATCTMTGDTTASIADVQFIVNEALGVIPANNDLNNDGVVNIVDIQKVLDAALNFGCLQ